MSRINPDRLHTLGNPLSNGRKPKNDKDEYIDRYGRTERDQDLDKGGKRNE